MLARLLFVIGIEDKIVETTRGMAAGGGSGHRWLTAAGPYAEDRAVLDIDRVSGGVFDSGVPPVEHNPDGTIVIEFTGCKEGTVSYDITSVNRQGVIPIERIALDNVALCEALAGGK